MLEFVRGYQGEGVVREYVWTDTGELRNADVWIYEAT
jgi:branched-chain amino acid transport system substrate-binding protein